MCLISIQDHDVKVHILATDRHPGVHKLLTTDYPDVKHQYDLWHIVKGVKKKLAKRKIAALSAWIKAVANHLWYCAATCDGDALLLKEMWTSILFHVTNRHHWATGEKFHRCSHEPYSEESERSRAWLEVESDAFKVLQGVVLDKTLLKSLSLVCWLKH